MPQSQSKERRSPYNHAHLSVRLTIDETVKLDSLVLLQNERDDGVGRPVTQSDVVRRLISQEHKRVAAA